MTHAPIVSLIIFLILLIFISAFFSGAETGMMAANRYRLRHLVRKGNQKAKLVMDLLHRPDRLLGVVLIGNTFANIFASSIATVIAIHFFGDAGVIIATVILTFIVLVFAETTPKTLGAVHPQRVAFSAVYILRGLMWVFYPLIILINGIANGVLRLFGIRVRSGKLEQLSVEELRTVVHEASGKISFSHQQMLLRILELEQATVDDIMIPRNQIFGIDITEDWPVIIQQLIECPFNYLPLYREDIDQVIGMLNARKIFALMRKDELKTKENLLAVAEEIYYVPEVTLLHHQLLNFQQENKSVGLVVDEYGDIQGLVTLQDIVEEIVGQFSVDAADTERMVRLQRDGSYLVDGNISIRDLNRVTRWTLPTSGPRTLSGLIIEYLEIIPTSNVSLRLYGYPMDVLKVSGNMIRLVQVFPNQYRALPQE